MSDDVPGARAAATAATGGNGRRAGRRFCAKTGGVNSVAPNNKVRAKCFTKNYLSKRKKNREVCRQAHAGISPLQLGVVRGWMSNGIRKMSQQTKIMNYEL